MMIHVFPSGPLCSLRRALLVWLLPVFVLVGGASAGVAYWSYNQMVSTFMDNQMELLAESLRVQEGDIMVPELTAERVHEWGSYVVQVFEADGSLKKSSWPELQVGVLPQGGFHNIRAADSGWYVYTTAVKEGVSARRVQVLQSAGFRQHLAAGRAWTAIAPVIVLLPLAILILWCV
ncbi:MAG: hypothetical protein Q8S16_13345, partial [Polaromonas sp.]|nr:hypothetical protein [Polaromonas sp.]